MTLFRSATHQELWIEFNCHRCFQPEEAARRLHGKETCCPILARALSSGRKPPEWDRMPRADEMTRTIKCNAYQARPPRNVRVFNKDYEEITMFDVDDMPQDISFVQVDGWPERPTSGGVDHQ